MKTIKYYLIGGSHDGTIVDMPPGDEPIKMPTDDLKHDEVYVRHHDIHPGEGYYAFGLSVPGGATQPVLDELIKKHKLTMYDL